MFEKLFGAFEEANQFMSELTMAANQKATAAKEVAEVTKTSKDNIQGITASYAASANEALGRLDKIKAQGDKARAMAESDNIIDRITLIGEQMLDPRAYTAEGRSRQVSEMSQNLALEGQANNIKIANEQAMIDQAQAHADASTAGVDAKLNTMKMQVDGLTLINQGIYQTETMRQQHLALAPQDQIQKALMGPMAPSQTGTGGRIKFGGFEYTPAELQERDKQLTTRSKLAALPIQATDPEYAGKLRVYQDLQLSTYSLADLQQLKNNGYIMQDGTQVEPQLWDAHYQRQNQLQTQAIELAVNQNTLDQTVPRMLTESTAMLKNTQTYALPGTPMAAARNALETQMQALSNISALPEYKSNPQMKVAQVAGIQKAQQNFMEAVDTEAKAQAGGNEQLASIYRNQMIGLPVTTTQVDDFFRTSYTSGKGFGNVLSNEANIRIRKSADDTFAKLKRDAANPMNQFDGKRSDKELREEAINTALEIERNVYGVNGINIIQYQAAERADNPAVKAGISPGLIREFGVRATNKAKEDMKTTYGITDAQVEAVIGNRGPDEGITPERSKIMADRFNQVSIEAEYDMLEGQKPGLGYEVQQWYSEKMPEMARQYTDRLTPTERVMAADSVLLQGQAAVDRFTQADESATRRGQQMVTEIATGAKKPENMWPILLQTNKNLADSQKHTIYYDVIDPALRAARAQGANDETASTKVFEALTRYKPEDPVLASSLKTMMRGLPDSIDDFQQLWTLTLMRGEAPGNGKIRASALNRDPVAAGQKVQSALPWLNKDAYK